MEYTLNKTLFIIFSNLTCFFKEKNQHFLLVHLVFVYITRCIETKLIYEARFKIKCRLVIKWEQLKNDKFINCFTNLHIYISTKSIYCKKNFWYVYIWKQYNITRPIETKLKYEARFKIKGRSVIKWKHLKNEKFIKSFTN